MKTIYKTFHNLQQDKLVICKKELMHISQVVSFFTSKDNTIYQQYFTSLKDIIDNELKIIQEISESIEPNPEKTSIEYSMYPFEYLANTALIEKKINDVLYRINILSNKITQIMEEHFEQYIPHPKLERRYSNKAIAYFLDSYINSFQKDKTIVNVWGTHNKYKAIDINDNLKVIENTFWYYELSQLIPALIHEVGHFIYKDSELLKSFKETSIQKLPSINNLKGIHEEVLADIFALEKCGVSYIYTLFYTQVYTNFDLIYYDQKLNTFYIPRPNANTDVDQRKSFIILLRLNILIDYYKETTDSPESHIHTIKEFLSFIYTEDSKKPSSLHEIYYENYPNYFDEYSDICAKYIEYTHHMIESFLFAIRADTETESNSNNPSPNTRIILLSVDAIKEETNTELDYQKILNTIWSTYLKENDNWIHPNTLRKKLLEQILNNITHTDSRFSPYELTFYKTRTDIDNKAVDIMTAYTKDPFFIKEKEPDLDNVYKTFGIFNMYSNIKKEEKVSRDEIRNFLELEITEGEQTSYYTSKVPLSYLNTFHKGKVSDDTDACFFGLIMRLQLSTESIDSIRKGYSIIENILKELSNEYKVFKALGPADFVITANSLTIEEIYTLKDFFSKTTAFRRTFSTIFFQTDLPPTFTLDKQYKLLSKIRLNSEITSELRNMKDYIDSVHATSGVTDVTILWKTSAYPLSEILEMRDAISETKNTSDIQTFISQRIELS